MEEKQNYIETNIELTQSQLLLWMGQKLNPLSPMYNMAHSFEIKGSIDETVFKKSFQELIDSIDIFRIIFKEEKGIPFQNLLKSFHYDIEVKDISSSEINGLEHILQKRTMKTFDLYEPLFDSILYKIGEAHYVWFLNIHHLVTDATSSTILFENFTKIYQKNLEAQNGVSLKIPQYRDYLEFEKNATKDIDKDDVHKYWKDTASKVTAPPILYGQNPKEITSLSNRLIIKLGAERIAKLEEFASKPEIRCWTKDLTYFNIFLTSLFVYINRISNEEKLAIGALSHSRVTNEFKKTAGMFVELFPLVAEFSEEDTFLSFYNKVRNETNEYLRHAQPGMASAEASRGFNVVLNYIKASFSDFNGSPTISKWIHPNHCDASHHMRCTVYDMDGTGDMELFFDLNTAVFNNELQEKIPTHFLTLFDAFLKDETQLIDKPTIINEETIKDQLNTVVFNDDYPSFMDKIAGVIEQNSDTIAIRNGLETYTYKDVNNLSNALAHTLKERGVTSGNRVGVHLYRSADYIISLIAILKLDAVFVPIAADQPKERIGYIIENSNCSLVVTTTSLEGNLKNNNIQILNLSDGTWKQKNPDVAITLPESSPDQLAYILYTSGSTGKPKGVMVTHNNLSNYLFWCNDYWGEHTKFAFCTSISFDITYTAIFLPLYHAGEIIVYKEDEKGPDTSVIRMLSDDKADSIILTPSHLLLFLGKGHSESKLRNVIVIGEDFKTDLANKIQNEYHKDLSIYNFYGPTEATIGSIITKFNIETHEAVSVPIGVPIYNTIVLVLDNHLNPVPRGVVGMLYLGGYGVAKGYVKRPELTSERFIKNPYLSLDILYNTGDLVRLNNDGDYEFFGRKDNQVKLNGHRIELREIESVLEQYEEVKEAVALVIDSGNSLKKIGQLVAFYRGNSEVEASQLKRHLEKQLPQYMIPLQFKYLEEFPLTPNAKVDRKKLSESSDFQFESNTKYVAPTNEIEEIIAKVWSEMLDVENIGIHDNFIALGGHSLLAMRITSVLNDTLEMENPLDKIFIYPTVASYAKYVEETIINLLTE
ncbi:non-ribosomal peptide synthetase [uncultured Winogradskyella sp.]|uniref:non-ribosomal peptide synthetase n=1 Tax=uncultured Winogradskyella sp. TaxID=395353 RepID=UPI0026141434|nr:non-ribosomal peptide synthetase [uncultured Winogradskyella sp.]